MASLTSPAVDEFGKPVTFEAPVYYTAGDTMYNTDGTGALQVNAAADTAQQKRDSSGALVTEPVYYASGDAMYDSNGDPAGTATSADEATQARDNTGALQTTPVMYADGDTMYDASGNAITEDRVATTDDEGTQKVASDGTLVTDPSKDGPVLVTGDGLGVRR